MRYLLIALLAAVLAGCWYGEGLYADSDARKAIEPGIYRASPGNEASYDMQVVLLPSGMTQITDKDGPDAYGFSPLDSSGTKFAVWVNDRNERPSTKRAQFYFVGQKRVDGSFSLYVPLCDGAEATLARKDGAIVKEGGTVGACQFTSRASLEAALRRLRVTDNERLLILRPAR